MRKTVKLFLLIVMLFAAAAAICSCSKNEYTLVFNSDGGAYINPLTVSESELKDVQLPQAEKEGYTFAGWYLDEELTAEFTADGEFDNSVIVLYAKFEVNSYTLTVHDGDQVTQFVFEYGAEIELTAPESTASRVFTGWYTDENCSEKFTSAAMPAYDADIYVGWADGLFVVVYDTDGICFIEPVVCTASELQSLDLPVLSKDDYIFAGWYLDEELSVEFTADYDFDSLLIVLHAKFSPIEYTVKITANYDNSFECTSGSALQTVSVENEYVPVVVAALTGYEYCYYELDGVRYYSDTILLDEVKSDVEVYICLDYATYELPIISIEAYGSITSKTDYTDMAFTLSNCEDELHSVSGGIRLRGNSTMQYVKKPYRIKFDKKQSLFGLTKAKSWVLLADYLDPSTLHNYTAFSLAENADGLSFTPTAVKVNVYINGEYMGLYTLCEQVQENDGRLNIEMETDADGYLSEELSDLSDYNFFIAMDYSVIGDSDAVINETFYFIEKYNLYFELKYPEKSLFKTEEQFRSFFEQLVQYTEDILDILTEGSLEDIQSAVNVDSLADYFLIDNIMCENDHNIKSFNMYYVSAAYGGKQSEAGKLSFGPIWDYDWSLNTPWTGYPNETYSVTVEGIKYQGNYFFLALGRFAELEELVGERYNNYFKQTLADYIEGFDDLIASISESLAMNNAKWYSDYDYDITQANVDFLKQFLVDRKAWLDDYFKNPNFIV